MRKLAAWVLLAVVALGSYTPSYAKARLSPEARAAQKRNRKQQKAMKRYVKAQQKAQRKAQKQQMKHLRNSR